MKKCLAIAITGLAVTGWLPASAGAEKLRVAVVDFGISADVTKEQSQGITLSFRETLGKNPDYDVLTRDAVDEAFLREDPVTKLKLAQYECINQEMACANQVGQKTGADKIVVGKIIKQKDTVIMLARMIDARQRNVEFEASEEAAVSSDLKKLAVTLAQKISRWLPKAGEKPEAAVERRLKEEREEYEKKKAQLNEQHQELAKRQAGTCPEGMVLIPAGEFTMGSDPADPDRYKSEQENKKVMVAEFCIDMFEFPNKKGGIPLVNMEWFGGKDECENRVNVCAPRRNGKRLAKAPRGLNSLTATAMTPLNALRPKTPKPPAS